jgi:hypothetical protein
MSRRVACVVAGMSLLFAAGCHRDDASRSDSFQVHVTSDTVVTREVPYAPGGAKAPSTRSPVTRTTSPQTRPTAVVPSPAVPAPSAESPGDPAGIVRDYYAAIRAHDFMRAYRMWQVSGQAGGRSYAQFEAGFDSTESVDAKLGAVSREEGAAGSRFVTVPVDISSRLLNGTTQRFAGTYTLRRVEVPGASAAQRRWHLYAANMRQVR